MSTSKIIAAIVLFICVVALSLLLLFAKAEAADITVNWQGPAGTYKLEYSANDGATWTMKDVGQITPVDYVNGTSHILQCSYTWTGLPDNGLIIIRVTAYNSVGSATRVDAGAWYNKAWTLPVAPKGAGVQ